LIRLDVITTNPGKMREFRAALEPLGFELDQRSEEIEEIQAETLEEVVRNCMAQLKARGLNNYIIDDSGLFIDSLHGFPGVYSAYALNTIGCQGMLQLLRGKDYRTARSAGSSRKSGAAEDSASTRSSFPPGTRERSASCRLM
jgi:XTP/dITP diphosphohydrolase